MGTWEVFMLGGRTPLARQLLDAGCCSGSSNCSTGMSRYVFGGLQHGGYVFNVFLVLRSVLLVSRMLVGATSGLAQIQSSGKIFLHAVMEFAKRCRLECWCQRHVCGSYTNPSNSRHRAPMLLFVTDAHAEAQAVRESFSVGVSVVSMCNTDSALAGIDGVLPVNNVESISSGVILFMLSHSFLRLMALV